jgi:hypothetical protein
MDSYYELFDLASGNVIANYETESDAMDALVQVVIDHGLQAIETFALTQVTSGQPRLIAMQEQLVLQVEEAMRQSLLVPQRRSS